MRITGWRDTGLCLSIWYAEAAITAQLSYTNIWMRKWGCAPLSARKDRVIAAWNRIKSLRTGCGRIFVRITQTRNGVRISHICFKKTGKYAITAALLTCMTGALSQVWQTAGWPAALLSGLWRKRWNHNRKPMKTWSSTATRGSQYTSKASIESCGSAHVIQSMSKARCPYDNAPMERYFNTLKNECVNLYDFQTEEALYQTVEEFAYVTYNHIRPHSYNGYRTPYQARAALHI